MAGDARVSTVKEDVVFTEANQAFASTVKEDVNFTEANQAYVSTVKIDVIWIDKPATARSFAVFVG